MTDKMKKTTLTDIYIIFFTYIVCMFPFTIPSKAERDRAIEMK